MGDYEVFAVVSPPDSLDLAVSYVVERTHNMNVVSPYWLMDFND